uniref:Dentin sialophosphoprotein-like isoform X1 n=1 Tax=Crassostrea virginica TaxID=6565 RepID=A0A8B8AIB2_CRAVI|nr:dentin sialophosphoprotein-like isoform X1 [Crassostrea virginica]
MEDTLSQNRHSVESENKKSSESSISEESSEIDSTNEISDIIGDTYSQNENSEESENKDSKEAASEESLSNSQSKQNIKDSIIDDSSSVVSESSENDDSKITKANYDDSSIIKYESQSHEASSSTDSSEELSAENNEDSGVVESVSADNDSKTKGDDDVNSDLNEESKEDTAESDIIDHDVSKQNGDGSADHSKSESTESSNESNNSDQSDEDLEKFSEKQGHNSDENLKENGSSQQKDGSSQNSDEQKKTSSVLMGILSNTMDNEMKLESSDFDQIKLDERSRESFDAHKLNSNNLEDKSSEETSDESNDRSSKSVDGIETPNNDLSVVDVDDYDIPFSIKSQDSDFYSSYLYHDELHKSNNFEMSLSEKTDVNPKKERSQKQSGGSKDSKESKESDINNRQVIGELRNDNSTDYYYDDNMFTDFLRGILEKGKENMVHNPPTPHSVGTDNEDTESGESLEKSRQDGIKTNESQQVDNNESIESQESKKGTDAINSWTSQNGNHINEKPSTSEFFRFGLTRNPFENGVIHGITNGFNAFVTTPKPFVPAADYDDDHDERRQKGRSFGLVGVSDDQTGGISSWNNGQHHLNTFANPHIGLNNHNGHGQHFGNEMIGQHQNFGLMGFSDTSSLGMQPNISPYNGGNTFSFHDLNHQPETSHLNHGGQSQDFSVHRNNNHHIESQWMPHESGIQGNWDQTLPQVTAPQQLSPELGTNEQNSKAAEGGPLAMELPTLENIPQQLSPELGTNEQYSHAAESGPAAMELPTLENIPQNNLPSAVGDNLLSSSPSATRSDLASSFPSHLDNTPFSSSSLAHQDPVNDAWSTGNKQASLDEASRPDRNIFLDPQTNYFSNGVQRVAFGTPNEQLNFNINLINEQPQLNNNQPVSNTQQNYGNNNHFNVHPEISAPFETIQTLPHYVDQAAHYVDKVPHHVDQATHSVDQTPHSVKQMNTHDEDSEERDDESSAGSNTSWMSSFVQPSEVYRNPFAVNDDVSEDQDHQQVNHNQHVETNHTDNKNDNNSNEDDNENEDDTDR